MACLTTCLGLASSVLAQVHTIQPLVALPTITDPVILDATTHPDFAGTPVIELDGSLAPVGNQGLTISAGSSVVRGFVINRFQATALELYSAGGNTVAGNYIGVNAAGTLAQPNLGDGILVSSGSNTIGGPNASDANVVAGNVLHGMRLTGAAATGNVVLGNLVGTNAAGLAPIYNTEHGIYLTNAPGNTIGGLGALDRNLVVAQSGKTGIDVQGGAGGNSIIGNDIGTDINVSNMLASGSFAINVFDSANTTIGGDTSPAANVIAGYVVTGVNVSGAPSAGSKIQGNFIGTDTGGGVDLTGGIYGVTLQNGATGVEIGGTAPGTGNTIAYNSTDGIRFFNTVGTGNAINQNNIYANNTGLGIDLDGDGVTLNDDESDGLQNFPVLLSAITDESSTITIAGSLNSAGLTAYRIEFFSNPTADPSGYGEGQVYLGFVNRTTSGAGLATFNHAISQAVPAGRWISATATSPSGDTSEFSLAVEAITETDLQLAKVVDDSTPSEGAIVTYTITLTNAGPEDATGISVTDLLPAGVTYVSDTPSQGSYVSGTGVWTVGDVANAGNATLQLVATVDSGTAGSTITNNAAITAADQADPVAGNNTASAGITVSSADLQLAKVVDDNAPDEGNTVTYTLTLSNAGPNDATGISVTDLLPAGVTYFSDTPSQGSYISGTGVWTVGDVANTGTATLQIVTTVDGGTAGSTITNNASITAADQADPVAGNNTASADITVGSADLQLAKAVDDNTPDEGNTVTYTVTMTNAGPSDATGISVTDLLPAGVTYVSDTPSQGSYVSGTGIWTVGNIANAGNATLQLVATVDGGTAGTTITNNAAITAANQADPVAGNNTASAGITVSSADLQLAKVVDDNSPTEFGTVTYTVTLSNAGPNDATGISVTDMLPAGVTYVSDTPSQGSYVSGTGVWTVGSVVNAGNATLQIVATVDGGTAGTTVTNNAAITAADQADPVAGNNAASAGITVTSTDLQLVKVVDDNTPNEGNTVTYTVTLSNAGPTDATGIAVTDLLPAGVTYVSDTSSQGGYVSGTGVWTVGDVANTGTATLQIVATVDGGTAGTTITNNASITAADQADPVAGNNTASAGISVGSADLQLAKVVDDNAPNEGNTVTYTVTITNAGPNDATGIAVTDLLPAGVTYVSDTPGQGSYVSGAGIWTVGNVANAGNATLQLVATVDGGTAGTTITNNAAITAADQADPAAGNNTASAGITVTSSDLQLAKVVDDNAADEGNTVTYTVTLSNAGPNDATGVSVTDLLPTGVTYVSDTPSQGSYVSGTGVWTVGNVANAGNATLQLVATVDGGTAGTSITNNTAITAADQADPAAGNNTASAGITVSSADLQLAKIVDTNAPNESGTVTYTVTVTNAGPNDATGIAVTDLLPAGVTYVSDTPSQGSYVSGTGVWTVGNVTNAGNATLQLVATVDGGTAGTTITNDAAITAADQADLVAGNNTASAGITVNSADLQLAKVVDNNAPDEGNTVTYTVTLANAGPDDATGISVTDLLPAGVTYVSDTPSQGSYVSGTGIWTVGNVANAGNATLQLVATVDGGTAGSTITNNAAITAVDQSDPAAGNNTASAAIVVQSTVPQFVRISTVPLEQQTLLPGGPAAETLRLELVNEGAQPEVLESLTVTNVTSGPGTSAQLDADWQNVSLMVDTNGFLVPPGTSGPSAVTSGVFTSSRLTFSGLAITLAPGNPVQVSILGQAALHARDGDIMDAEISDPTDVAFAGPAQTIASWPLESTGSLTVDGMVADQLDLRPVDPALFVVGSTRNLAFDVGLPANGYEGDELERLNIISQGNAVAGLEIARMEAWADGGDNLFDPLGDTLLGEFAFTGTRWELTGVGHTVPLSRLRIFVTVDIAETAREGRTLQLGLPTLPDVGIGMVSGNDGPIDREVFNPFAQAISASDRVILSSGVIVPGTVAPGQSDVPLLHLVALNAYSSYQRLTELSVRNGTTGLAAPGSAELDQEFVQLQLRADGDGDGLLGDLASDPVIATGSFVGGNATFSGLAWDLTAGASNHLFVTGNVSTSLAADGDVLAAYVNGGVSLVFENNVTVAAAWPLDSGARWTVDGLVAAQVDNTPVPGATLAAGEGPALVLDVEIPANGYAADVLTGLKLINRGTAVASDMADLRLWRDGGDGVFSGGGDDVELGPLTWLTDGWLTPVLNTPLPLGGTRLFVGLTVAATPTEAATVRMAIPVAGITVASGNDGPIDDPVISANSQLLSTAPLLAEIRFDQAASTVGQTVTVRMQMRNVGGENLLGVAPDALLAAGDGTLAYVSGPSPATIDLAPGASDSVSWTYTASSSGTVTLAGGAAGTGEVSGQPRVSLATVSGPHEIYDPATSLELFAVANMPFTINRGQADVVPLTLTFVNAGGGRRADALISDLRIRLRDDSGTGIVPSDLLSRVVVNEGGITYLDKTNLETTGNEIDLSLSQPVQVTGLEPVTLGFRLDIHPTTVVPAFMVEIINATWIEASDAISGAPVPILLQDATYPVQSGLGTLLVEATGLQVTARAPGRRQVGFGQQDVTLMALELLNPGTAGLGSEVRVGALEFSLTDTLGAPLATPSQVLERLRVTSPLQTLLDIAVAEYDSTIVRLNLASPLNVPVDTPLEVTLVADVGDPALAGGVQARLLDATTFLAVDNNSGNAVPVNYGTDPMIGDTIVVQQVATEVMALGTPLLPSDLVIGARQVPALTVSLRHPGTASVAAIHVASLVVQSRDGNRDLVAPNGIIDALEVLRDGAPVGAINNPTGDGNLNIPLSDVVLQPGQTVDLTLQLSLEAGATSGSLELLIPGASINALDINLGQAVTARPESGEEFPLTSGLTRLQESADELRVGFASLMPAVLVESADEIPVAALSLRNPTPGGVAGISLAALTFRAADDEMREVLIGEAVTELRLYQGTDLWATSGALAATDTVAVLVPTDSAFIGPAALVELELAVTFRAGSDIDAIRFGLNESDISVVQPDGALTQVRIESEPGLMFPYWTDVGSFTGASLAASYSNFPNPFAAGSEPTHFVFALNRPATVTLQLLTGHARPVVTVIASEFRAAGLYQNDAWGGRNGRGVVVQNGVYIAELTVVYEDGTRDRIRRKVAVVR